MKISTYLEIVIKLLKQNYNSLLTINSQLNSVNTPRK